MTQDAKREAAPVLQHQDGGVETGPDFQTGPHLHHKDTTPAPAGARVHIADFLGRGETHAVPMRHLKELLHLPARTVRLMIRAERLHGVPILESSKATNGGYFLPCDIDERTRCVRRLRHRAAQIIAVADAIAAADIEDGGGLD